MNELYTLFDGMHLYKIQTECRTLADFKNKKMDFPTLVDCTRFFPAKTCIGIDEITINFAAEVCFIPYDEPVIYLNERFLSQFVQPESQTIVRPKMMDQWPVSLTSLRTLILAQAVSMRLGIFIRKNCMNFSAPSG